MSTRVGRAGALIAACSAMAAGDLLPPLSLADGVPADPTMTAADPDCGIWANVVGGEWRAHLRLADAASAPWAGTVVEASFDGVTWTRVTRRFVPDLYSLSVSGTLPPGADTLSLRLTWIDQLGVPSATLSAWDDDGDNGAVTPEVPLRVSLPQVDGQAPAPPDSPQVEWQGDGFGISWDSGAGDVFGYVVERSVGGAAYLPLNAGLVPNALRPSLRDTATVSGQLHRYRLIAEDVSGNRSLPSDFIGMTPP